MPLKRRGTRWEKLGFDSSLASSPLEQYLLYVHCIRNMRKNAWSYNINHHSQVWNSLNKMWRNKGYKVAKENRGSEEIVQALQLVSISVRPNFLYEPI